MIVRNAAKRSAAAPGTAPSSGAASTDAAAPQGLWPWGLALALAAAAAGVALYKGWPLLSPEISERAPLSADCDLRRTGCAVRFDSGGEVRLAIRPRGIPVVEPLTVDVHLTDLPAPERVELDLAGYDMDMGFNRVALSPVGDVAGRRTHFRGSAMLPVCIRDRMTWEARVLLHDDGAVRAAPFRFETVRAERAR